MSKYLEQETELLAQESRLQSLRKIYRLGNRSNIRYWLWGIIILLAGISFLPWTQNVRARGSVTTVKQEQRPQQVNAIIGGSIKKWFIKEGDFVKAGDTLLQLSEVKMEYLDTFLIQRVKAQIDAKEKTREAYNAKAATTTQQNQALEEGRNLKLQSLENKMEQQRFKIRTDEAELVAVGNELSAYLRQIEAAKVMLDSGVLSLTDFERRKINYQNSLAKSNSISNKLEQSRRELENLRIEQQALLQDYADKMAKTTGDRFSSISDAANTEAELLKLRNQLANYDARNKLYYIVAPQSGQITKARKAGIGEFIKDGDLLVEIVPDNFEYAVELFVKPMDLPLINVGQKVRFVFDGFPAIVFSGWPGGSYGTFGGKVIAVSSSVSENGKFRVLVTEDESDRKWPRQLKIGGGADAIMLLKDVRIYYELWRNVNGFPPEFYQASSSPKNDY